MRRLVLLVVLAAAVAAPVLAATTHDVRARNNAFTPDSLTITEGDAVRWTNEDLQRHTVTFPGSEPYDLLPGAPITIRFNQPGTYRYQCDVHPSLMKGTVVVQGTSGTTTTSTTRRSTTTSTTQDARGSAITAPPDTSTTSTSSTTSTTLPSEETTTTTAGTGGEGALSPPLGHIGDDNIDGPGAVAALLLLGTSGAAFLQARTALR